MDSVPLLVVLPLFHLAVMLPAIFDSESLEKLSLMFDVNDFNDSQPNCLNFF
jgi:hypothetical protein